jgi:hypothetical protein
MLRAETLESLVPVSARPNWMAFLQNWERTHGSKAVLPSDLVTEFRLSGLGGPMTTPTKRAVVSTINRLLWRCAGRVWSNYAIAWQGVDDAGRYLYRLCRFPDDQMERKAERLEKGDA